jgi:hypothetical protein
VWGRRKEVKGKMGWVVEENDQECELKSVAFLY